MYLWLKRLFYGCNHQWVLLGKTNNFSSASNTMPVSYTIVHQCNICKKLKKSEY